MLNVNPYDQHVAGRLLDFFGASTAWHRSLWVPGVVLTLKEVLEASEAQQAGILSEGSIKNLIGCAQAAIGPDPGIGPEAQKSCLQEALRSPVHANGAEYHRIKILTTMIERDYLTHWANAMRSGNRPKPERAARAIASFLLDAGFSAPFLHRWWTFRIKHEDGIRSLADFIDDSVTLFQRPARHFRVLVAFEAAAEGKSGVPAGWLDAGQVSDWLKRNNFEVSKLRQNGGMWFEIDAPDQWSAVEKTVEIVDRLTSRVNLGTTGRLIPVRTAWVEGQKERYRFSTGPRRVEVHALHREDKLYTLGRSGIVDAAIELLAPLNSGSPSPAVIGAWAAIEALLSGPGEDDILAANRMASLVACSFIRAELTMLSFELQEQVGEASEALAACVTNRDRADFTAKHLLSNHDLIFGSPSDIAAISRMRKALATPHDVLRDIENHITTSFRRLYRQRNLVVHWGKTDAVALKSTLRTVAPLVGAGMDRIAHGWFVEGVSPIELSARARLGIDLVGISSGPLPVDLLS